MATIDQYLRQILEATYGEEVRHSIHDAILQNYNDVSEAIELANTAATNADTAAQNADTKAQLADTAATNANEKATLANTAATNANEKATLANTAATNANEKATLADTSATRANQAAASAENMTGIVAPTYSASGTYKVGQYAVYDGQLYRCIAEISTAEEWTAAHWTAVPLGNEVSDLKSAISDVEDDVYEVTDNLVDIKHEKSMWKQGYRLGSEAYAITYNQAFEVGSATKIYAAISDAELENNIVLLLQYVDSSGNNMSTNAPSRTNSATLYPSTPPDGAVTFYVSLSTQNYLAPITIDTVDALGLEVYVGFEAVTTKEMMYSKYITALDKVAKTEDDVANVESRMTTIETKTNPDLLDNEFGWYDVDFSGYSSKRYEITRLGTWQVGSYAYIRDFPVTEGETIIIGCKERKVFTQNIGAIEWYDSTGARIGSSVVISASFLTSSGGIYAFYVVPTGAVKVTVSVYGVGNYTSENTPEIGDYTYVGELYIKKGQLKTQPQTITDINEISESKIGHLSELLMNQSRNDFPTGTLYGFKYSSYTANATNQTWVNASHVNIYGECSDSDIIHWGAIARNVAGTSAGFIEFLDSTGTVLWQQREANTGATNNQGGFTKVCVAPEGSVSFRCGLYGISSGEATVVGEEYFIKGAFVFVGEMETVDFPHLNQTWLTKADEINQAIGTRFCFGIQTDSHYYDGISDNVAYNLSEYTNLIGTDFIANLGDIIQGYSARDVLDRPDRTRKSLTNIVRRYISAAKCPVLFALGNHDSNRMHHDKFGTDEIPMTEMWNRLTKRGLRTCSNAKYQTGKFYYYVDFNDVRVIVCNSQDSDTSAGNFFVTDAQETWLRTEALNTGKPVLVLSHVPFIKSGTIDANYTASYAKVVSALQDFKTNGGTVIACISGHTHAQLSEVVDGILYITCTQNYGNEYTAEIFTVDLTTKTIQTFGLGAASDRTFSYA